MRYNQMLSQKKVAFIAVCMTIVICYAWSLVINAVRCEPTVLTLKEGKEGAQSNPSGDSEFHLIAAGQQVSRGKEVSFQSYRSAAGVGVLLTTQILSSARNAEEELEKRVDEAARMVERGAKLDRDGRVIGERAAIIFFDATRNNRETAAILWTRKSDLIVIESDSIAHALAFEKECCR